MDNLEEFNVSISVSTMQGEAVSSGKFIHQVDEFKSYDKGLVINAGDTENWAFDIADYSTLITGYNCYIECGKSCVIKAGHGSTIKTSGRAVVIKDNIRQSTYAFDSPIKIRLDNSTLGYELINNAILK